MPDELRDLWENLRDPEYFHLILGELTLYGPLFGLVFLVAAFAMKAEQISIIALLVILGCSALSHPYIEQREKHEKEIRLVRNDGFANKISDQLERRSSWRWAYIGQAILCGLALAMRKGKAGPTLLGIAMVGSFGIVVLGLWLHRHESEITHPNLLLEPGEIQPANGNGDGNGNGNGNGGGGNNGGGQGGGKKGGGGNQGGAA